MHNIDKNVDISRMFALGVSNLNVNNRTFNVPSTNEYSKQFSVAGGKISLVRGNNITSRYSVTVGNG